MDDQDELRLRAQSGCARYVHLDPDGTSSPWAYLIVEHASGVIYATQCGGTTNDERLIEGYLVPVDGAKEDMALGRVDATELARIFHTGGSCPGWSGPNLPAARLDRLRILIAQIPYWILLPREDGQRLSLRLDESRLDDLIEGWIPVMCEGMRGVLLHDNCDYSAAVDRTHRDAGIDQWGQRTQEPLVLRLC